MQIGIDIDGVLADVLSSWVKELNFYFNQDKKKEDIFDYRFEVVYNVSWEEMDKFFRENQQVLLSNLSPIEKAHEVLEQLSKHHEIILITARPNIYRDITEKWLRDHSIPYHKIIFTNFQAKTKYCLDNKINLFIEDSLENAIVISEVGIPVLLFDAPYNRRDLPKFVFRKFNWDEILEFIENWEPKCGGK